MRNAILKSGFIGLFFFGITSLLPAEVRYTVTDLGTLGATYAGASAINDNGQIVGALTFVDQFNHSQINHAFLWKNGVMTDLGQVQDGDTYAQGINAQGHVVGTSYNYNQGGAFGFFYNGTSFSDFGIGTSIGNINDSDQVAGSIFTQEGYQVVVWTNGIAQGLETVGGFYNHVYDINNAGKVVGSVQIPDDSMFIYHATLWENSQLIDLGTLGGQTSGASDINNLDQIVGSFDTADHKRFPFLWQNGSVTELGTLDDRNTSAFSINDLGQIVGIAYGHTGDDDLAVLWEGNQVYDLSTLIDPNSGWLLNYATDINNKGQIVGGGIIDGNIHAFLLNPVPEPAALILFLASFLFIKRNKC